MSILPKDEPLVNWRAGVATRLHTRGMRALCVLEQRSTPGAGAPTHTHFDTEEVIVALADVWADGATGRLETGDSIVLPPQSWHGFRNASRNELHTLALFGSPRLSVAYEENPGVVLEIGSAGARFDDTAATTRRDRVDGSHA